MRLSFRQGIVRYQQDTLGTPTFLDVVSGHVSLIASNEPTVVTFVHGPKDYLYTERQTQNNAWGPFVPGPDQWLYWQLNPVTGAREFGSTNLEPVVDPNPPSSPGIGQMWFSTMINMWHQWTGSGWSEVIRVFACKLQGGILPVSVSINAPDFGGTQVGLSVDTTAGDLVYDLQGKPIRTSDRRFFTSEDQFFTGVATGSRLKIESILVPAIVLQTVHKYQVVQFDDYNKILPAVPFTQMSRLYGMVEEDAVTGDVVDFVTEGMIHNEDWDWVTAGAQVNDPVYIDNTGDIKIVPHIGGQMPVGFVVGARDIYFAPRLFSQVNASINFDRQFTYLGAPVTAQFIAHEAITRTSTIAGSPVEHTGYAEIAPIGGDAVFELFSSQNGGVKVSRGTLTFGEGSKVLTDQSIDDFVVEEGGALHLQCLQDNSIEGIAITLKGNTQVFWKV